ncbi:MAG: hypothetical protein WD230_03880, partial [Cucumibacter sp.]
MSQPETLAPDPILVKAQSGKPKSATPRRRGWHPHVTRGLIAVSLLVLVGLGLYGRLIFGPLPVPYLSDKISELVNANLPAGFTAEFSVEGVMMENGVRPMVVISPFKITEIGSGASITVESMRVAFAPFQALFGRPAADLILLRPHVQAVQDFRGVRLASLEFATNEVGESTVRILADQADPGPLVIDESGIALSGGAEPDLLSDNDWIVLMVNEIESLLAITEQRFELGELRQIEVRDASVELIDQVYRLYRNFENIDLLMQPERGQVHIELGVEIGPRLTRGSIDYTRTDFTSLITGTLSNIDLAVFLPMLDDEEGMVSLKGGSEMQLAMEFEAGVGVTHGRFDTDINDTVLQIQDAGFPISGERTVVEWTPGISTFTLKPAHIRVGDSQATIEGKFALGVDSSFGPTIGLFFRATDMMINPYDLSPAAEPIDVLEVQGWSAAVYGAIGIDRMHMEAGGMRIDGSGRFDLLQRGIGIDFDLAVTGASVDQVKRIWPYFIAGDIRTLFVERVNSGAIEAANLSIDLEPGVVDIDGFTVDRVPTGGVFIDAIASDLELAALEGDLILDIEGKTRIRIEDNAVTLNLDKGSLHSGARVIELDDVAYYNTAILALPQTFEVSGEASGDLASLTSIANQEPFRLLEDIDLGITPDDLSGHARMTVIAQVSQDETGKLTGTDYTLNGTVENFASSAPVEGRMITEGNLTLVSSRSGYQVKGTAKMDGVPTDLVIETGEAGEMQLTASATLDAEARRAMGFDFEEFITGTIRYVARPQTDAVLQLAVDLTEATLDIDQIGVSKPAGEPGTVTASVSQADGITTIEQLDLSFGTVHLMGSLQVSQQAGLIAADFTTFQLNPEDLASLSITPIEGGYRVAISGAQLDLKPVISRYLGLSAESAVARSTTDTAGNLIELRLDLERALGFYRTTAFGAHFDMALLGNKLLRVDAQALLGGDKSMSITTNSLPQGRVMTVAVNDFGTMLRFIGTYPRILGGEGSLVMTTNDPTQSDRGEMVIRNFAVIDEAVVAQILGNQDNSRELISSQNRVEFTRGRAVFERTGDALSLTEAAFHGDRIGGTVRGNIYTKERRYDLVGTYVPFFGINNMFRQLPVI